VDVLCIIGARAGSKGLPGKNVRMLAGKPLLAHAVGIGRACQRVSRVLLSTDSEQYAAVGREHGAETPFLRPAEHASDTSIELHYIRHALEWLAEHEQYRPDAVVRICPTAPLIRPADAISYITERGADVAPTNRQSYAEAYNRQSLPIVSRRDTVLKQNSQTGEVVLFHVVPQETALDIDTDLDFRIVETLLTTRAP
jgi:CMP-N-acetylneuraminic acid synthetase